MREVGQRAFGGVDQAPYCEHEARVRSLKGKDS